MKTKPWPFDELPVVGMERDLTKKEEELMLKSLRESVYKRSKAKSMDELIDEQFKKKVFKVDTIMFVILTMGSFLLFYGIYMAIRIVNLI